MSVKILVECPALIASVRVGVLNSLKILTERKTCNVKFKRTLDIRNKDIAWADIIICVRGCESPTLEIIRAAKENRRFIIYFLDDDLLNIPANLSCSEYFGREIIKNNIKEILKLSDVLWYVNPLIGEVYSKYTDARCVLAKVCAEPSELSEGSEYEKVNVLYAGSVDHKRLLDEYITPAVCSILKKHTNVTFTFIGAKPDISKSDYPSVRILKYFESYDEYSRFVKEGNFSIGLAVVNNSRFYQCKYFNKFIEYTRYGITGIYTDSMPYTAIVRDGFNGILTENSVEAWTAAIDRAVSDAALVQKCRDNAREALATEFAPEAVTAELTEMIPELQIYKAPQIKLKKIKIKNPYVQFALERTQYYIKTKGLLSIFIIPIKVVKVLSIHLFEGCEALVQRIFFRNLRK